MALRRPSTSLPPAQRRRWRHAMSASDDRRASPSWPRPALAAVTAAAILGLAFPPPAGAQGGRSFATPDEAVRVLSDVVRSGDLDALIAIFGPEGRDLVASSDPATGRRNREVFVVAVAEGWRLVDAGPDRKELVVGNEGWPFPIPLVKRAGGWGFDTAAGKDEVLARRIGRNELAVIGVCRTFVRAQLAYAAQGRDGKPAGLYARRLRSDPGKQNGLYWPATRGQPRSPLGELVATAAAEGTDLATPRQSPVPFHGYYFRILEGQGASAPGGATDYVVGGEMSKGFALVAWPAQYDVTGVMTFIVGKDGNVFEKDLGPETSATVATLTRYDPDSTWREVETGTTNQP